MKNNMKHTSFFKALALFAFVFMAFACSNIFNKLDETNADGKSYISIKVGESLSRTILSDAFDLNDSKMSFALAGYIGEEKIVEKSWTSYQLMTAAALGVEAGTYNFTLTATYKNDDDKTVVFEDTAENVVVESGKTTALNFTLKEKEYNLTGQGSVDVTVNFPSDFGAVRAVVSLHDFEKFPAADSILKDNGNALEWEFGTAEYKAGRGDAINIGDITDDGDGKMSFQYTENLDAGNYILKISFYSADGVTEIEPGYAEALEIRSGRTSTKTIETYGVHSHTINTGEWSKDDDYHWHAASCGIEAHNIAKAAHSSTGWKNNGGDNHWKTCDVCGEKFSEEEHTFSDTWKNNGTNHWHECECGAKKDDAEHEWDTGVITTPPTTEADGVKTFTCVCGKTKTQAILKLGDKVINNVTYSKTEEVNICTTSVTVKMEDDSSWSGYVAESADDYYKGVFISGRSVTLSPFAMGKYEVTQELFQAVMGTNPSYFNSSSATGEKQGLRPVEKVNWYDAIAFCNKLSIIEGLEPCYSVSGITDWASFAYASIPTSSSTNWNAATCDFTKKGYRLPTEAEWEYAARGGNASAAEWKYAFSGVNVAEGNMVHNGSSYLQTDANLEDYAWYTNNFGSKTHEVGKKSPNSLGLYDMSGNVWEWCWDWYSSTVSTGDVTDPTGPASGSRRLERGGSWYNFADNCAVSRRISYGPSGRNYGIGFRLARSL